MTATKPAVQLNDVKQRQQQPAHVSGDEFLSPEDYLPIKKDAAQRTLKQALSEIIELNREKRWEDIIDLFYPVDDKQPELVAHGLDLPVREKTAFALGQVNRHDDAIGELTICVKKDPENFYVHSSLAYTAYDSLYAAKNRDIFLSGKAREERIRLAHEHFEKAQILRPDGVTNYYRQGMLYRKIQDKPDLSLPRFKQAVANWDSLSPEEQEYRHQERKNFIKALYQLASVLLQIEKPTASLEVMNRCIAEDEVSQHVSLVFKYFALGKIHYQMNRFTEARDALKFAVHSGRHECGDFVYELLARTYLSLGDPPKALKTIENVPEKRRRPYVRWTEADARFGLKDLAGAEVTLKRALERDNRSRHKTLIRLCRIDYLRGEYEKCRRWAEESVKFYHDHWMNPFQDGLFWQAVSEYRLGRPDAARQSAQALYDANPHYPKLGKLMAHLEADR